MTQESELMARIFELCEQGQDLEARHGNLLAHEQESMSEDEQDGMGYLNAQMENALESNAKLVREALALLGKLATSEGE